MGSVHGIFNKYNNLYKAMKLRKAIQLVLGISIMQVCSSSFVYGMTKDALIAANQAAKNHNAELAMERKFYDGSLNSREGIMHLQNILGVIDDNPFPLFHKFSGGLYTREMHVPKGVLLIGKIHRNEHLVHLAKGKILVADEYGTREVIAPATFNSKEGVKRVGYIFEDVVWIDIHKTNAINVEDAELDIFVDSYQDLDEDKMIINGEYESVIEELGFTVDSVRRITEIEDDIIFDEQDYTEVRKSAIEGNGIFATKDFKKKDIVGIARIGEKRTLIGRYTNHSSRPNTVSLIEWPNVLFIATRDIDKSKEITVDYRDAVNTSKKLDTIGKK